jgi:hypothetical protein
MSEIKILDEDWCAVDMESKVNKKIDELQSLVFQQHQMIHTLATEISTLKQELHSAKSQTHSQNDRTHQLLEELKVMKQRELNLALRSHIPVPFTTLSSPMIQGPISKLRSPLFKATQSISTLPRFPKEAKEAKEAIEDPVLLSLPPPAYNGTGYNHIL